MNASKIAALRGAVDSGGAFDGFGGFGGGGGFGSPAASSAGFGGFGAPAAASSAAFGFAFSSFVGGDSSSLRILATVTHANHRVLAASLGLPVPSAMHIPLPPLNLHPPPGITYRYACPSSPRCRVLLNPLQCKGRDRQASLHADS